MTHHRYDYRCLVAGGVALDGIAQSDVTLDANFASDFLFVNSMSEIIEFMHVYKGVKIYIGFKAFGSSC